MKTETLSIEGMSCGHCTGMVRSSLEIVKGVSAVDVKLGLATIEYDEDITERSEIENAVTRFGYKIKE